METHIETGEQLNPFPLSISVKTENNKVTGETSDKSSSGAFNLDNEHKYKIVEEKTILCIMCKIKLKNEGQKDTGTVEKLKTDSAVKSEITDACDDEVDGTWDQIKQEHFTTSEITSDLLLDLDNNIEESPYFCNGKCEDPGLLACSSVDSVLKSSQNLNPHQNDVILNQNHVKTEIGNTAHSEHKKIHSKKRLVKCSQCEAIFTQCGHCERPMRIHIEEKPLSGTESDSACLPSDNMTQHMSIQIREKSFKCSKCDAAFTRPSNLNKHMRIHTGEKPYKCSVCDSSFAQSDYLKRHMRTHTGERPFKCIHCNDAFALSGSLAKHMRIHTGAKPYTCSQCDAAFSQLIHLKRHVKIHTGERPFKCTECDASFNQTGTLKKHMQIHKM